MESESKPTASHQNQPPCEGAMAAETASNQHDDDDVSEISNLSGLDDDMNEGRWRQTGGMMSWIQLKLSNQDPRVILKELLPENMTIPDHVDDITLWRIVVSILTEPERREKLSHINTMDDAVGLIKNCTRIMVLTGAGISVSCGIPDFRSRNGIYARLAVEYPDLAEPQDMFDISFFAKNPRPFFKFASEIYPGKFVPSVSHRFIKHLDDGEKLLRNYTQNIDTLEQCAGIKNVIQCHGSFATAKCMVCKYTVNSDTIKDDVMQQRVPKCPQCPPDDERAVMKPEIVFFGEGLPEEFHKQMEVDKDQCDLLIVIGSSLKVRPVALIPNSLPAEVPQILINREPLRHMTFDVELLGDCDVIIETLARRLGEEFADLCSDRILNEIGHENLVEEEEKNLDADDSTCDSVIQNIEHCHLCIGNEEECTHKNGDSKVKIEDEKTQTSAQESMQPDQSTPSTSKEADAGTSELVSSDFQLGGATAAPDHRPSLAERLPADSYAFLPPNRYLFPGGELPHYKPKTDGNENESDLDSSGNESESDDSPDEHHEHQEDPDKKIDETHAEHSAEPSQSSDMKD